MGDSGVLIAMLDTTVTTCPSCRAQMSTHRFARKLGGEVVLDLCFPCQGIWFDEYESLQLAPGGVIELFKLIHAHGDDPRLPLSSPLHCPRCREGLIQSQDRVKSGLFNYLRCGQQHGRFITFGQFMIEKGFVRQISPAEIRELKVRVAQVRCNSCGAPVDIRKESACAHCRAPIAVLDADAVEKALSGYLHGSKVQAAPAEPMEPVLRAEAVLHRARERGLRGPARVLDTDIVDLLQDGVAMVWNKIR